MSKQTDYQRYTVAETITIIPTATHNSEHNCQYYYVDKVSGMKTDNVAITAPTNGTITVSYTSGEGGSITSGDVDLAHTSILTVSAAASMGYKLSTLTINEVAHTSGNTHVLSEDATVAATFVAKTCTVVFDTEGGSGTITNVTATYGSAMPSKASNLPTKTGYTFGGFWDGDNGTGTKYYNADGSSAKNWDKNTESNTTLYAKWTINSHTLTWDFADGSSSETAGTHYTAGGTVTYGTSITYPSNGSMSKTNYTFSSWSTDVSTMPDNDLTITAQWTANTYDVDFTLSNAAYSSGTDEGENVASYGTNYSVVFAASSGYSLPDAITVTIGGNSTTQGTEYTWNSSTGALTVNGSYITGDIAISITAEEESCSFTLISATLSSCSATGDVTGAVGGTSTVSFSSCEESSGGYKMGKDGSYMHLTLSSGNFAEGDVVSIEITKASGLGDTKLHIYKYMSSTWTELGSITASSAGTYTYTLTAANVATDFNCIGLYRTSSNQNPYVKSLSVTRACTNHTVTWMVNGEEYTTGSPTTSTNERDGVTTLPTAPDDDELDGCANSFRGWSETNLYGEATNTQPADLFVTAAGAPAIMADKTFYAVFGTATSAAPVGTVLWSENWTDETAGTTPSSPSTSGSIVYGDATVEYEWADGKDSGGTSKNTSKVYNGSDAGGSTPEAFIGGKSGSDGIPGYLTISGISKGKAKKITLSYKQNANQLYVNLSGTGYSYSGGGTSVNSNTSGTKEHTIICGSAETFSLTFTATNSGKNVRLDDIVVKIKEDGATGYRCICPSLTVTSKLVTASTPIFITSAASKTVRSQDSLVIVGSGLQKNATLSISSPVSKFALKSRLNGTISTDANGAIDTVAYIYYTPDAGDTSDGLDKNNSFTISDGTNSTTVNTALIGRHLPADFVIAAKSGDKWYALPANMGQGDAASTRAPVEITVDDATTPTTATTSQLNVYSLIDVPTAVHNRDSGEYVILWMHGKDRPLFGNQSTPPVGSSNKYVIGNLDKDYWWALTQINTSITNAEDAKYNISVANGNTSNPLKIHLNAGGIGVPYWGLYSSASNIITELRLIPWTCVDPAAPTISGETEYTVGETITLTASCATGADAMTSYTWYKGATWDAASAAEPVQAAAKGSSGYTFTKASCVAGDAGTYWCEASNGSCTAHNSIGYTITVTDPCFYVDDLKKKDGGKDIISNGYITNDSLSSGTITGGTLQNTSGTSLGHSKDYGLVMESGRQVTLTLTSPSIFEAGTVITVKSYSSNQGASGKTDYNKYSGIIVGTHKLADSVQCTSNTPALFTQTYTVTASDGIEGGNSVTFARTTAKTYIYSIKVTGCGERSGYTVTYDGNGNTSGDVPEDEDSPYDADATVTVLGNTGSLAKNGYTFADWNNKSDGTGADFAADGTFTITQDTILYAKWTPNTYTITYNLNGASWASSAGVAEYTVGTGATLPLSSAMTNTGYTFGGWYDNSGLTGSSITTIGTSEYGDKEFWAKWTENTYTITYNANGGSGTTTSTVGHYVTVADNGFTAPSGKTFVEWNTLSTGLGSSYNEGDEIELTANMTLYAIWAKSVGTINWTVTKIDSKLYRGGGGYTIKAEIDDASWDASDADSSKLVLTASEGVVLRNIAKSINASGKAQITAKFDITTDVNANATKITFTLTVPENNGYAPLADDHNENLDNCTDGKVEVRFTSSNKNDEDEYFDDLSSGEEQMIGNGLAKMIATGDCKISTDTKKNGYRSDRSAIVFKLTTTTTLDVYYNAGSTSRSFALYSFSSAKSLAEIGTSDYSSKTIVTSVTAIGAAFGNTPAGGTNVSSGVVSLSGSSGGLKATYSSLSAGYYVLTYYSGEGYFYGFDADAGGSGGGAVTPTLTWDTDLSGGVAAETGDADFTHTVTQNKNSLGAITYASSNTSVATVNATTGKVHIVGGGSTTITATMEESGCYEEATASYDITVTDNCDDVPGTIEVVDLGCSGIQMTVTGYTSTGSETFKWYKDGEEIDDATSDNYTATSVGEYYVEVTNPGDGHCSMASTNTVTVTAKEAATATTIVDEWYVKNGRRTPDIALVQTENADNFQVKSGETEIWNTETSVTTGFAGCSFYLGTNGIIYLMGQKPDGSEPSGLTAGDETLTFIAKSCGGDASVDIKIHKQAATDYKTVAFVVDGTKEGAWNAVKAGHADGTMLYEYLDSVGTAAGERKFMLYERNIYKTTNEDTLRQHYSQFDAILITDDPNTRIVPDGIKGDDAYKTKGYVNAIGSLIDIRPILTMEAYVSALANWKAKGIDGNPSSPNPRQYAMKLDCKNHAIFVGIDPSSTNVEVEDIDGVEYWTVAMVDSTKSPYSGVAYDEQTDDKPALQGFSASDVSDLMLLGEISDGALYAGVERQEEPAARLLLLGLNNKALPNALTPEGRKIIENTISYLIETDMEKVDDCSNYFTGAAGTTDWNTAENWSKKIVPNSPYVKARILKPCVLSGTTVKVARVDIATSGKSLNLSGGECSGSLTIAPTGALIVGGAVRSAVAPYFNTGDLMPTGEDDLILNTNSSNQACLIFNNDKGDTKATVNLYSLGRNDGSYKYQYFAIPMEYLPVNPTFANETHGGTKIYTYVWEEGTSSWTRRKYYDDLYAFEGLGITTNTTSGYMDYTMAGNLTSTAERDITLTYDGAGNNIIGNSYTAPINIASLVTAFASDESVVKTVYIYSTGRDPDEGTGSSNTTETAGQWLAIPMEAAAYEAWDGLKVIPSMQAFLIQVTAETGMTLDYDEMVRTNKTNYNEKLHAPQRFADEPAVTLTRLRVADTQTHTDLYLFEGEQFSDAFDNGWEAAYMEGDGRSAKLCAETEIGQMAVAALEEIEGTVLNFAPGQEMTYTFTFSGAEKGYYLNDLKLRTATLINEENNYEFTYEEGDANRFYISRTPINSPAINTGVGNTDDGIKARKILYNNKLYILLNGRVYSAEGAIVK